LEKVKLFDKTVEVLFSSILFLKLWSSSSFIPWRWKLKFKCKKLGWWLFISGNI